MSLHQGLKKIAGVGATPYIGTNGNWWVLGKDTGHSAGGTGDNNNIIGSNADLMTTNKETIVGAINEVFQKSSDKNKLIADAITGMGQNTSENATGAVMAHNIKNISKDTTATALNITEGKTAYTGGRKITGIAKFLHHYNTEQTFFSFGEGVNYEIALFPDQYNGGDCFIFTTFKFHSTEGIVVASFSCFKEDGYITRNDLAIGENTRCYHSIQFWVPRGGISINLSGYVFNPNLIPIVIKTKIFC